LVLRVYATSLFVCLQVGDLSVLGFGERIDTVHTFGQSFSATQGGQWLQQLTFDQQSTAIGDLLERAALLMQEASDERSRQPNLAVSQLLFVLSDSDNLYQGGKAKVEQWCHALRDRGVFVVFVIFDAPEKQHSVLDQKTVSFTPSGVVTEEYMDRFTDKNYILLRLVSAFAH
jgi:midasin